MPPKILIIHQGPESLASSCLRFLDGQGRCETRNWESLGSDLPVFKAANLILAHPPNEAEKALMFFRWLGNKVGRVPILAVLPQSVNHEVLQSASEIADDFLFTPLREQEFQWRLARMLAPRSDPRDQLRRSLAEEIGLAQLVGRHPAFLRAIEKVRLFSSSDAPVLISGETGTGKELFAHAIHSLGSRRNGPFIPADCGTLPESLAENELFGHCRGAFTDAHVDQKGLAGMAAHGSLFLDEIDALSLAAQSILLRFLQEGSYRSLGADRFTRADVRIIAATNRPIEECVRQKRFRSDLYFRLNVLRLDLPPLRERLGDVSILARHFAANPNIGGEGGRKTISPSALRKLEGHSWPGNVRELFNTIQRASVYCPGTEIQPSHVWLENDETNPPLRDCLDGNFQTAKRQVLERFEREYTLQLLERHGGNVTHAAHEAGKERRAFGRMVKKYGIRMVMDNVGHF